MVIQVNTLKLLAAYENAFWITLSKIWSVQGVNKKMAPPKSDCKHKMVLQIGLCCIVWLFMLFVSKMLASSNIFFESFYFRKSHFLIRCSNPEFTFLNTDIFSNTLLPIFPTFFLTSLVLLLKVKKRIYLIESDTFFK